VFSKLNHNKGSTKVFLISSPSSSMVLNQECSLSEYIEQTHAEEQALCALIFY